MAQPKIGFQFYLKKIISDWIHSREFKPNQKFFRVTISSVKYTKNVNSGTISLHVYNNSQYKITLPLRIYATISPTIEFADREIFRYMPINNS